MENLDLYRGVDELCYISVDKNVEFPVYRQVSFLLTGVMDAASQADEMRDLFGWDDALEEEL